MTETSRRSILGTLALVLFGVNVGPNQASTASELPPHLPPEHLGMIFMRVILNAELRAKGELGIYLDWPSLITTEGFRLLFPHLGDRVTLELGADPVPGFAFRLALSSNALQYSALLVSRETGYALKADASDTILRGVCLDPSTSVPTFEFDAFIGAPIVPPMKPSSRAQRGQAGVIAALTAFFVPTVHAQTGCIDCISCCCNQNCGFHSGDCSMCPPATCCATGYTGRLKYCCTSHSNCCCVMGCQAL